MGIFVDLHRRYKCSDTQRLLHEPEPYSLVTEGPSAKELRSYTSGCAGRQTPISSGENYYLRYGLRGALEKGPLDDIVATCRRRAGF